MDNTQKQALLAKYHLMFDRPSIDGFLMFALAQAKEENSKLKVYLPRAKKLFMVMVKFFPSDKLKKHFARAWRSSKSDRSIFLQRCSTYFDAKTARRRRH
jgi:hypothetical protein